VNVTISDWQRSSVCQEGSSCLELGWQTSSYSGDSSNCIGIAAQVGDGPRLRESDDPATVIATTPARLAGLLAAVKAGRLGWAA
jgi:Domain of unknown function (DUF397)